MTIPAPVAQSIADLESAATILQGYAARLARAAGNLEEACDPGGTCYDPGMAAAKTPMVHKACAAVLAFQTEIEPLMGPVG